MKKLIMLFILLLIIGCEEIQTNTTKEEYVVELTSEQKELAGNNQNIIAELLIKNAVLKEKELATLSKEEEKKLKNLIENVELEFFIEKNAAKGLEVDPVEIVNVYEANKEKFNGATIKEVAPQIKQLIINQKLQQGKIDYVNGIIAQYNLNDKLKEYSGNKDGNIDPEKSSNIENQEEIEVNDLEIKENADDIIEVEIEEEKTRNN